MRRSHDESVSLAISKTKERCARIAAKHEESAADDMANGRGIFDKCHCGNEFQEMRARRRMAAKIKEEIENLE